MHKPCSMPVCITCVSKICVGGVAMIGWKYKEGKGNRRGSATFEQSHLLVYFVVVFF